MTLFLDYVDKQTTWAIVLYDLSYTCSFCKENNRQSFQFYLLYVVLFFPSGFFHKKNEDDDIGPGIAAWGYQVPTSDETECFSYLLTASHRIRSLASIYFVLWICEIKEFLYFQIP